MFAGDLFYILALFWSKLSVCLFFRRLSASTQRTLLPDIMTCVCTFLSILSMFAIGIRQQATEPWMKEPTLDPSTVSNPFPKHKHQSAAYTSSQLHCWIAVEVFAISTDLAIMVFPLNLVWGLQMQNSMKFWVTAGFGVRLPYVHSDLQCSNGFNSDY
jgi:hypothetical protein